MTLWRFMSGRLLAALLAAACTLGACKKEIPNGVLPSGEIALTFDDNNVNNWHTYLPLLDSLNIRATFYVSKYHRMTAVQKQQLRDIATHGHEIAYHSTNHPDMAKLLEQESLARVMYEEIQKDLDLMNRDGFYPQHFAYPYGSRTTELDVALLRLFKSVRAAASKKDWTQCLTGHGGAGQLLFSADVDQCSGLDDAQLASILSLAQSHHDCAVLTAHDINKPQHTYQITLGRLRLLAREASRLHLQFVTVSEIAK